MTRRPTCARRPPTRWPRASETKAVPRLFALLSRGDAGVGAALAALATPGPGAAHRRAGRDDRRRDRRQHAGRVRQALRRPREAAHRRAAHDRPAVGRGGDDGAGRVPRVGPRQGGPRLEEGSAEAARTSGGRRRDARCSSTFLAALAVGGLRGEPLPARRQRRRRRRRACRDRDAPRGGSAQPGVPGAGRRGRPAAGGVRPERVARAVDAAGRGDRRVVSGASVLVHGSKAAPPASPNGQIVGRDLGTGAVLWQHPIARRTSSSGTRWTATRCYVVERVATSGGKPAGRLTALDGRTGARRWEQALPVGAGGGARGARRAGRGARASPSTSCSTTARRARPSDRCCRRKRRPPSCARCPRGCSTARAACS